MFLPCLNDLSCNEGCIIITESNAAISNLKYLSLSRGTEEQCNQGRQNNQTVQGALQTIFNP